MTGGALGSSHGSRAVQGARADADQAQDAAGRSRSVWRRPRRSISIAAQILARRAASRFSAASSALPGIARARRPTRPPTSIRRRATASYTIDRPVTPEAINTNYNNFYEFGTHKNIAGARRGAARSRPWEVKIDGLVEKESTIGIDDLIRKMPLEERLYRHRCVEAWSMTVPWTGFPLADARRARQAARRPRNTSAWRPSSIRTWPPARRSSGIRGPTSRALTMAEATNELAFMVTGAYGKPVAKSMGAPLRVHLPWKYGFKSIKSIVRFTFTDERPISFWQQIAARASTASGPTSIRRCRIRAGARRGARHHHRRVDPDAALQRLRRVRRRPLHRAGRRAALHVSGAGGYAASADWSAITSRAAERAHPIIQPVKLGAVIRDRACGAPRSRRRRALPAKRNARQARSRGRRERRRPLQQRSERRGRAIRPRLGRDGSGMAAFSLRRNSSATSRQSTASSQCFQHDLGPR